MNVRSLKAISGAWFEELDEFFHYECGGPEPLPTELNGYCNSVREWRDQYFPKDFGGRLRVTVRKDFWHHSMRDDVWKSGSEIDPLAEEIMRDPRLQEANIDFLCSPAAQSAAHLGMALGRRDSEARLLDPILAGAIQFRNSTLLRGYVANLLTLRHD